MATARAIFQAHVDDLLAETLPVALQWSMTSAVGQIQSLTIGTNTTITVPSGTTLIILIPPTTNTNALTLKGASGDTGVLLSLTKPTVIAYASGTVILNAASSTAVTAVFL